MGIVSGQNKLWDDVLENGPSSRYADFFDIDWQPPRKDLHDRVLLPILGDAVRRGAGARRAEGQSDECEWFRLAYFDQRFPLSPKSASAAARAACCTGASCPRTDLARLELESILSSLRHLPDRHRDRQRRGASSSTRQGESGQAPAAGAPVARRAARCGEALAQVLRDLNGCAEDPHSFDTLDRLLREQSYRLASWRVAAEEINYRRFFDINELAAIRMESPPVFEHAHALLFRLTRRGQRQRAAARPHRRSVRSRGLLRDAAAPLRRRSRTWRRAAAAPTTARARCRCWWRRSSSRDEQLRSGWPVDGTTGYEFACSVLGLWVEPRAERPLTRPLPAAYRRPQLVSRSTCTRPSSTCCSNSFSSELNMLAQSLQRIASEHRRCRDFTWGEPEAGAGRDPGRLPRLPHLPARGRAGSASSTWSACARRSPRRARASPS